MPAATPQWVTIEDGLVAGGAGEHIARQIRATTEAQTSTETKPPKIKNLGVPANYIPHGNADEILRNLGLDSAGITAAAQQLL